jgi:hypothetical protein
MLEGRILGELGDVGIVDFSQFGMLDGRSRGDWDTSALGSSSHCDVCVRGASIISGARETVICSVEDGSVWVSSGATISVAWSELFQRGGGATSLALCCSVAVDRREGVRCDAGGRGDAFRCGERDALRCGTASLAGGVHFFHDGGVGFILDWLGDGERPFHDWVVVGALLETALCGGEGPWGVETSELGRTVFGGVAGVL